MKKLVPWTLMVCIGAAWVWDSYGKDSDLHLADRSGASLPVSDWEAFHVDDLIEKRSASNRAYLPFLNRKTLSLGLYSLKRGSEDRQPAHDQDEVYYVKNGKALLRVGDKDIAVRPGSIVYVKADVAHRFHSIEGDLDVVVFFSPAAAK